MQPNLTNQINTLPTCVSQACPIEASMTKIILSGFYNKQKLTDFFASVVYKFYSVSIATVLKANLANSGMLNHRKCTGA